MKHLFCKTFSLTIVLFLITSSILTSITTSTSQNQEIINIKILSIGLGENGDKYILAENGTIYKLLENGNLEYYTSIKLDINQSYWVEFYIEKNTIYLYSLYTVDRGNYSRGVFTVKTYLLDLNKVFSKNYTFELVNKEFKGHAVISAITYNNYIAIESVSSTGVTIDIYRVDANGLSYIRSVDGKFIPTPFLYDSTLISIDVENQVPYAYNILNNEKLFELPSLQPLVTLSQAVIQIFKLKNKWVIYAYPLTGPYAAYGTGYMTWPNTAKIRQYPRSYVQPILHYVTIHMRNYTLILFDDGIVVKSNYEKLTPTALGNWEILDTDNEVLDINKDRHWVLAKIIENTTSKIILIKNNETIALATIKKAAIAYQETGLHGAIVGNTIYWINPETRYLEYKVIEEEQPPLVNMLGQPFIQLGIVLSIISIVMITTWLYHKSRRTR